MSACVLAARRLTPYLHVWKWAARSPLVPTFVSARGAMDLEYVSSPVGAAQFDRSALGFRT